ncbi:unnamed protein product [Bursaphelenchus xylophilus]|uniref:(pine wood nematode) hypothetical protein n=1 Tax=Bursaphelenchus xylophilus TaxID=6326 RepID=A0A7I8X7X3_BURXY|nr:unnamed protein product [Bursaphelenchus xylophilus]CAG9125705.1 unnamed protein product [Bursaphelenchus xylophilus]
MHGGSDDGHLTWYVDLVCGCVDFGWERSGWMHQYRSGFKARCERWWRRHCWADDSTHHSRRYITANNVRTLNFWYLVP